MTRWGAAARIPTYVQRLPRAEMVDRSAFLIELARGRKVIHLGFGGGYEEDREQGLWLHDPLVEASAEITGVDVDADVVAMARVAGYAAETLDCTDLAAVEAAGLARADLVIAGEIIEHVDSAGGFLEALHVLVKSEGQLVLTTPNAYSAFHFGATLVGREVSHPDHVALYSWYTLSNMLGRHGWKVDKFCTYRAPAPRDRVGRSTSQAVAHRVMRVARRVENRVVARWQPFMAEGLIAVCSSTRQ